MLYRSTSRVVLMVFSLLVFPSLAWSACDNPEAADVTLLVCVETIVSDSVVTAKAESKEINSGSKTIIYLTVENVKTGEEKTRNSGWMEGEEAQVNLSILPGTYRITATQDNEKSEPVSTDIAVNSL